MGIAGAIVFIILAIIAVRMIVTAINSNSQKALAEEETQGYTMVDSTELGEDGNPIQVPVPDGFTASQVPGETTVNGGFVIYEGEVDWSKIRDLDSYAEIDTQAEETDASAENSNLDSSNSENSEEISAESNNEDATSNSDSNTTNESNSEEVEEKQTQDANTKQADLTENLQEDVQENTISGENEILQNQIDEENSQGEMIDTEQTDNIEEDSEELEEANNEVINEEEEITNEEAEIATMSEEGEDDDAGIATLAEGEIPTTVFELQTSVNQYVWVPVKDVSRIYEIDSNGKLWGKVYDYDDDENATERNPVLYGFQEPAVISYRTNYDVDGRLQSYRDGIERYQMLSQEMEENFYKMIESVKKYGGFYIGRYETGDLSKEKAVVKKMSEDIYYGSTWYEMYEKCKGLRGEKENIETGMIWGSLWDETLQWLIESEAEISTGEKITYDLIAKDSTKWGNYWYAEFEYKNTSGGTSTKNEDDGSLIPTGSTEYTKVNNIYDLAGNLGEATLEFYTNTDERVFRGGEGNGYPSGPVGSRSIIEPTNNSQRQQLSLCTLHKVIYA